MLEAGPSQLPPSGVASAPGLEQQLSPPVTDVKVNTLPLPAVKLT